MGAMAQDTSPLRAEPSKSPQAHERATRQANVPLWEAMRRWSISATVRWTSQLQYMGGMDLANLAQRAGPAPRLEACRRIRKGWTVAGNLEQMRIRYVGFVKNEDFLVTGSWSSLFTGTTTYQGDMITVGYDVTTMGLWTGIMSGPYPRRGAAGMRLELTGGVGLHRVACSYGIQENTFASKEGKGVFGTDRREMDKLWDDRREFARSTAFGLSAQLEMRVAFWLHPSFSLYTPILGATLSLVKPQMAAQTLPDGERLPAHTPDLTDLHLGLGMAYHF